MRVFVPSPLHRYTGGRSLVEAEGAALDQVLADLDARYPGIRFRMIDEQDTIRPHINLFVNGERVMTIFTPLSSGDEVHIIAALSGG